MKETNNVGDTHRNVAVGRGFKSCEALEEGRLSGVPGSDLQSESGFGVFSMTVLHTRGVSDSYLLCTQDQPLPRGIPHHRRRAQAFFRFRRASVCSRKWPSRHPNGGSGASSSECMRQRSKIPRSPWNKRYADCQSPRPMET